MSTFLLSRCTDAIRGIVGQILGSIGPLSVHPASPILLTKNGPLGDSILVATSIKKAAPRAHLEFENRARNEFPYRSNHCFTGPYSLIVSSYPKRNFRENQLLDSSMSLSPLYQGLTSDLHVSTASNFHQGFPWLHPAQEKLAIFRVPANIL